MFYDVYSLENSLNIGEFENSMPQLDNYKLIEALKFLTIKVKELEFQYLNTQTELTTIQAENGELKAQVKEHKSIIKKVAKDYPEIVFAKPHFFAEDKKNDNNK